MPIERPLRWRDVRTGLLILAVLTATALLVFFLDEARRALEEGPRLTVVTPEAPGLEPGSPVWIAGKPMGRVLAVRFRPPRTGGPGEVVVHTVLSREAEGALRADAEAEVEASGLLAPMVLALDPGSASAPPYDFADTLRAVYTGMEPEEVMALADSLREVLAGLRPLRRDVATVLEESRGTYGALLEDEALLATLGAQLERAGTLFEQVFAGRGTVGRLLADSALAARLERIAARSDTLSRAPGLIAATEDPGALAAAVDSLQRTLASLDTLLAEGRGTAGRVLYDGAIPRELTLLRARLDSAWSELAADPFRYLRFRLF